MISISWTSRSRMYRPKRAIGDFINARRTGAVILLIFLCLSVLLARAARADDAYNPAAPAALPVLDTSDGTHVPATEADQRDPRTTASLASSSTASSQAAEADKFVESQEESGHVESMEEVRDGGAEYNTAPASVDEFRTSESQDEATMANTPGEGSTASPSEATEKLATLSSQKPFYQQPVDGDARQTERDRPATLASDSLPVQSKPTSHDASIEETAALCDGTTVPENHVEECDDGTYPSEGGALSEDAADGGWSTAHTDSEGEQAAFLSSSDKQESSPSTVFDETSKQEDHERRQREDSASVYQEYRTFPEVVHQDASPSEVAEAPPPELTDVVKKGEQREDTSAEQSREDRTREGVHHLATEPASSKDIHAEGVESMPSSLGTEDNTQDESDLPWQENNGKGHLSLENQEDDLLEILNTHIDDDASDEAEEMRARNTDPAPAPQSPETAAEDDSESQLDAPAPASSPALVEPVAPQIFSSADPDLDKDDAPVESQVWTEGGSTTPARESENERAVLFASESDMWLAETANEEEKDESLLPTFSEADPNSFPAPPHRRVASPSRLALSYLYYRALEALYVEENVTLFVHRARDAAPYGHARLNWLLGVLHAYGLGVPRSERDAIMYYSFAAMEGVPEAHMALGYRYQNGLGVRASCELALAHYREAADAVAMTYDGSAADLDGRSVADVTGARTILSGSGGRSSSTLSLLTYRDNIANSDRAHKAQRDLLHLIYQADSGSGQALLTLGYVYLKGSHQVRRDGRKAEEYLKQAAAKGVAEAHGALGNLYTSGDASIEPPMRRDLPRAYHHYRLGALMKDATSLNGIGFLHAIGYLDNEVPRAVSAALLDGKGAGEVPSPLHEYAAHPPDFATAARYFERSPSPESTYNLAVLHLYGRGVQQDRAAAQRLFHNAATGGSVLARWQLAHLIDETVEAQPGECAKALELYKETASFGSWHRGDGPGASATFVSRPSSSSSSASPHATAAPSSEGGREGDALTGGDSGEDGRYQGTASSRDSAARDGKRGSAGVGEGSEGSEDPDGPTAPRTSADYERLLSAILARLHSVEDSLRLSDEEDGPAMISLASFVELLSLTETGDAASTWLAAKFVEEYLEVQEADENAVDGRVTLMWPAALTPSLRAPSPLHPAEVARGELLYYLLQRTVAHPRQKSTAIGAAYLRLGDFFYHGESAHYGVDMARAMEYYRIAADVHHYPQALFNVGFMYQLGLHKAPRATLVSSESVDAGEAKQPGGLWKIQSDPPYYLTGAPSLFLAAQAAAHAWNRDSANPMSRGVDVYLAWKYYSESLRREGRGWMAVRFALLTLNVQWSLRHFGLHSIFAPLPSPSAALFSSFEHGPPPPVNGYRESQEGLDTDARQALLETLSSVLHAEVGFFSAVLSQVTSSVLALFAQAEQTVLYGATFVFVLAMLVRHHAV